MKNKIVAILLSVLLILSLCPGVAVNAAKYETVIVSATTDKGGAFEIIGRINGAPVGTDVTFIMGPAEMWDSTGRIISLDNIIYIDETVTGNNGTFLIQGVVDEKWANQTVIFAGNSTVGEYFKNELTIGDIFPGIEIIEDNSVIYGRDAYLITGAFYTPDNIAKSIKAGSNRIYYKLGGEWYDLLAPDALDNSYLIPDNAISKRNVEECKPRYYYDSISQRELKYN